MGLDCSMLWRGGKSSQAVGTAGLFGACHRDASRERRRAAALSRFAALQRVRVSPKNRGSVNAALVSNRRKAVPRSRRCCSAVSSAGVVVAIMGVGVCAQLQRGIGRLEAVARREEFEAEQAAAGTAGLFGAGRGDAIREAREK